MKNVFSRRRPLLALMTGLVAVLLTPVVVVGAVALTDAWGWGTNVGWINLDPLAGGVMVCDDHLEGYAWGENIGWIRLGTVTGCATHTYANISNTDYGVNRDGSDNLSGYAWGTNIGWINFDPANGGVTFDAVSGKLAGFAWAENVGWIRFNPDYGDDVGPPDPPGSVGGYTTESTLTLAEGDRGPIARWIDAFFARWR